MTDLNGNDIQSTYGRPYSANHDDINSSEYLPARYHGPARNHNVCTTLAVHGTAQPPSPKRKRVNWAPLPPPLVAERIATKRAHKRARRTNEAMCELAVLKRARSGSAAEYFNNELKQLPNKRACHGRGATRTQPAMDVEGGNKPSMEDIDFDGGLPPHVDIHKLWAALCKRRDQVWDLQQQLAARDSDCWAEGLSDEDILTSDSESDDGYGSMSAHSSDSDNDPLSEGSDDPDYSNDMDEKEDAIIDHDYESDE